jgi:hypothetical protein
LNRLTTESYDNLSLLLRNLATQLRKGKHRGDNCYAYPLHPAEQSYVTIDAEMDDQGNVTCHVAMTCTDKIVAMIESVTLTYLDKNNNTIGTSNGGSAWRLNCGPAPIIGAAHANSTYADKAPVNTSRIMVGQVCANDFGPVLDFLMQVVNAIIKWLQSNPIPQDPGGPATNPGQVDDYPDPNPPDPGGAYALKAKLSLSAVRA